MPSEKPLSVDEEQAPSTSTTAHMSSGAAAERGVGVGEKRFGQSQRQALRTALIVLLLSIAGGVAFLVYGITHANSSAERSFQNQAQELARLIATTWKVYENAALSIHNICRRSRQTTRQEFRETYEYLTAGGIALEAVECSPKIMHHERESYENKSRAFYKEFYSEIDYQGIVGFVPNPDLESEEYIAVPSPPRDFYWVVEHVEPVVPNAAAIDLDMYSYPSQQREIDTAVTTRQPVLSKRLHLIQETIEEAYGVIIYHPGIYLESQPDSYPMDLSLVVVRMQKFLKRVAEAQEESLAVFLYDTSILNTQGIPEFLVAGEFKVQKSPGGSNKAHSVELYPEMEYDDFLERTRGKRHYERSVSITPSGTWIVAIVSVDGTYEPSLAYILFGGIMIMIAGIFVAVWVFMNARREAAYNEMQVLAETEKAALIVKNAEEAAQNERELNDFLAHEVRNPLAAAISATSFVSSALNGERPLTSKEAIKSARDDVSVIKSCLDYANDLLRNMLDIHKASCDQLHVDLKPTALRCDVFEPVATILKHSTSIFTVDIQCCPELTILTDRIRLKQIVLNLASNACKFVERGFVRIGTRVRDDKSIEIFVEDSGPGIPLKKRETLFEKFQTSLDSLCQGTGVGLFLCKVLSELLGGEIWLDETYDSGIEGCPGARIVVHLNATPLEVSTSASPHHGLIDEGHSPELPKSLRVLFVDDDLIVRKLFMRAIKRIAPMWDVQEAANGETALRHWEEDAMEFDLMFMDQYMASIQKQMLGTETVRALRSQGYKGRICGLSANAMEEAFLAAGADAFILKPIPVDNVQLRNAIFRILDSQSTIHPES